MEKEAREFEARLTHCAGEVTTFLDHTLSGNLLEGEICRPERLVAAMRHGVLNGGKRLRPFLLMESAALFGVSSEIAMSAAAALECVHCYSLIHDDLPAMDDDDLRRGQPTVHRAFDEATAILAGDGLLTLAFDMISSPQTHPDPSVRIEILSMLARAGGIGGMVGGQMLDLEGESRSVDIAGISRMQKMKTGALIKFACEAGAVLGGAPDEKRGALRRFGDDIGAAFQLIDDLLDLTATTFEMGKRTAKDQARGKATLVSHLGIEESRRQAEQLLASALHELTIFDDGAPTLAATARFIVGRHH